MRRGWLALPLLACATACSPVKDYREAARGLRFHLDRVEPDLKLTLPPSVVVRVVLGVENPSSVPFHLTAFAGDLRLESQGAMHPVGHLELARPLELPAGGAARLEVEVTFSLQELRDHWGALQAAAKGGSGTWHLEGALQAQAYGLPLTVPVRSLHPFGQPR